MCTAATYKTNDFYFGRTLDYEFSYGDEITVTPRNYPFKFKFAEPLKSHYAIIGMAYVADNYPLLLQTQQTKRDLPRQDLILSATHITVTKKADKCNVAQCEFIPWLLCRCASVDEAKKLLSNVNITNTPFNESLPPHSFTG